MVAVTWLEHGHKQKTNKFFNSGGLEAGRPRRRTQPDNDNGSVQNPLLHAALKDEWRPFLLSLVSRKQRQFLFRKFNYRCPPVSIEDRADNNSEIYSSLFEPTGAMKFEVETLA